jgi:iron complex outermembrane receptor protein
VAVQPGLAGLRHVRYTKQENRVIIQPTPLSDQITYGPNAEFLARFLLPPTSPYYPTAAAIAAGVNGQPLNVRYRAYALGNRDTTDTNDQWQGVVGVKGSRWNWDFDFDFVYSKSETSQQINGGFARYSQIVPLLNSGLVNPFGQSSDATEAALQALQYRQESFSGESTGYLFEGKASGDLAKLPAGALSAAIGFQAGKQTLKQTPNGDLALGDITGFGGNLLPNDASRTTWAVYGELAIPIVKTLEATAAVRYDHYSDFGNTTNPKFSLRWNPAKEILFRGSWGTGFVAPTLTQAYGLNTSGLSQAGLEDPLRCPTTKDTNDCLTQFTLIFGGNPDLKPQKSTQWTVGAVWEPVTGFSIGVDWFDLQLKDLFSNGVTPNTILQDQAQYGNLITRGPVQPQYPTIPGPITSIDQRFINLGEVRIEGFDVDLKWNGPATSIGRFSATLSGTYYSKYDVQQPDGTFAGFISNAFGAATLGITPRYKQYATVTWQSGPWQATLGNQYIASYIDENTDGNDNLRRVGNQSIWDLYGAYTGFRTGISPSA